MKSPRLGLVPRRTFLGQLSLGAAVLAAPWSSLRGATATPGRKLGLALVGLGNYSTGELGPALRETEFVRLAGVVTGTRAKGEKWAQDFGFPTTSVYDYATMDRIADNPDIDIVYIVTPVALHAEQTIRALQAGKHVICEKPMAMSVAECDQMIAASVAAKRALTIGYRLHADPHHQELMRLERENEFGPFKKIVTSNGFKLNPRDGVKPWRAIAALAGGGPLMDMGVYSLHAACMAAGAAPIAVTAKEEPKLRPEFFTYVEETLNYTLEFANGAVCTGSTSYERGSGHFRADAERGWFEMAPAFSYRNLRGATSKGLMMYPPLRQQAKHLDLIARSLIEGTPLPTPAALGRRDMCIVEAIYAAAKSGRRELVKA